MAFLITFMNVPYEYPYEDTSAKAARGVIVLGDSREEFLANLRVWTQAEYRDQWKRSIGSIVAGERKAVLITAFSNPIDASHLEWWALYREGENVFAQNQLFFFDDLKTEFDANRAAEFLRERQTQNEEGLAISEWSISMDELRHFATQIGA